MERFVMNYLTFRRFVSSFKKVNQMSSPFNLYQISRLLKNRHLLHVYVILKPFWVWICSKNSCIIYCDIRICHTAYSCNRYVVFLSFSLPWYFFEGSFQPQSGQPWSYAFRNSIIECFHVFHLSSALGCQSAVLCCLRQTYSSEALYSGALLKHFFELIRQPTALKEV